MQSLTSITLNLQAPNIAVVAAAKQNDSMSRKIAATLRDGESAWTPPAGAAAMIRYAKPDGTAGFYDVLEDGTTPAYSITGNVITITLCEQALTVPGNVFVEINFYTSTEKLTTFYFLLAVQKSVLEDATIVSSDYYNVLTAEIQAVLGAVTNPPLIDPVSKNWMIWDDGLGSYVITEFSSVGTQGEQGPAGVSVSSVTWVSNSGGQPEGTPGTTDTYRVNLSNGTSGGTFTVGNGANGAGSPGSATPLSDSGSGVVGTANAYSREDHRHPLNVPSSGTPAALGTATNGTASTYARSDHAHKNPSVLGSITTTTTWAQQTDDWTQTVTVSGATVTSNSKVDLQAGTPVIAQLLSDGVSALYAENNAGTVTLHAVGAAPSAALTLQCTVTEVLL